METGGLIILIIILTIIIIADRRTENKIKKITKEYFKEKEK